MFRNQSLEGHCSIVTHEPFLPADLGLCPSQEDFLPYIFVSYFFSIRSTFSLGAAIPSSLQCSFNLFFSFPFPLPCVIDKLYFPCHGTCPPYRMSPVELLPGNLYVFPTGLCSAPCRTHPTLSAVVSPVPRTWSSSLNLAVDRGRKYMMILYSYFQFKFLSFS